MLDDRQYGIPFQAKYPHVLGDRPSPHLFRVGYASVHHCQNTCFKSYPLHTSVWKPRLSALHRASIFTAFVIFSTIHITAAFVTAGTAVIHIVRVWWALTIHKIMNLFQLGKLKNNKHCWFRTLTVTCRYNDVIARVYTCSQASFASSGSMTKSMLQLPNRFDAS